MSDFISREALGIGFCNPDVFEDKGYANGWNAAIKIIQQLPAADVREVKRGKWEYEEAEVGSHMGAVATVGFFRCSECDSCNEYKSNYCPCCGAEMEEQT